MWKILAAVAALSIVAMGGYLVYRGDYPSRWLRSIRAVQETGPAKPSPTPAVPKAKSATMTVKVFFGNSVKETEGCSEVFPVSREIPVTDAPARAAVEALLPGPTESESRAGYYTSLNSGVRCLDLSIRDGIAHVDLDRTVEADLAGSCQVEAVRAQVERTLRQFSTVRQVRITVEGREWTALQP